MSASNAWRRARSMSSEFNAEKQCPEARVRLRSRSASPDTLAFQSRVAAPRIARRAKRGAQGRDRTTDTAIFSRMLYQLSYPGIFRAADKRRKQECAL